MTSGIYKLTFKSGHYYIGKSKDIERRWKEHYDKLSKGTAAKNMQWCFDNHGPFTGEIIVKAHPDHLDVLEPLLINTYWAEGILNTTRENFCPYMHMDYLDLCQLSLSELCRRIRNSETTIDKLKDQIDSEIIASEDALAKVTNGTALQRLQMQFKVLKKADEAKAAEINRLKNRSFLQRLFDL